MSHPVGISPQRIIYFKATKKTPETIDANPDSEKCSKITDLGKLTSIGKDLDFSNTQIKDLKMLPSLDDSFEIKKEQA